jgi:hypothetical protein
MKAAGKKIQKLFQKNKPPKVGNGSGATDSPRSPRPERKLSSEARDAISIETVIERTTYVPYPVPVPVLSTQYILTPTSTTVVDGHPDPGCWDGTHSPRPVVPGSPHQGQPVQYPMGTVHADPSTFVPHGMNALMGPTSTGLSPSPMQANVAPAPSPVLPQHIPTTNTPTLTPTEWLADFSCLLDACSSHPLPGKAELGKSLQSMAGQLKAVNWSDLSADEFRDLHQEVDVALKQSIAQWYGKIENALMTQDVKVRASTLEAVRPGILGMGRAWHSATGEARNRLFGHDSPESRSLGFLMDDQVAYLDNRDKDLAKAQKTHGHHLSLVD